MDRASATPFKNVEATLPADKRALSCDASRRRNEIESCTVVGACHFAPRIIMPLAMAFVGACAGATIPSSDPVPLTSAVIAADASTAAMFARSSGTHLTRMDLVMLQGTSVADAVLQLRPEWLRSNPSSGRVGDFVRPSVYVDKTYVGGPEELRLVPLDAAVDLQFLAPTAASDRFGPGCRCAGGAIVVLTRRTR